VYLCVCVFLLPRFGEIKMNTVYSKAGMQ